MDTVRSVVLAVAGVIVLVAVATGPLGVLTVPSGQSEQAPGTGNATVRVVSTPDQPTIEPGQQGGDVYYLSVPDAGLEVSDLHGNPVLTYSITVEELGYTRSSVFFLGQQGEGTRTVSLERSTLEENRLDADTYRAQVELVVRANDTERSVYNETTTVEVSR